MNQQIIWESNTISNNTEDNKCDYGKGQNQIFISKHSILGNIKIEKSTFEDYEDGHYTTRFSFQIGEKLPYEYDLKQNEDLNLNLEKSLEMSYNFRIGQSNFDYCEARVLGKTCRSSNQEKISPLCLQKIGFQDRSQLIEFIKVGCQDFGELPFKEKDFEQFFE